MNYNRSTQHVCWAKEIFKEEKYSLFIQFRKRHTSYISREEEKEGNGYFVFKINANCHKQKEDIFAILFV